MKIQLLNPLETPGWDDLLLTSDRANFFHTTAWARVLSESYAYKPLYFSVVDNGHLVGLIPVMEIDSFLTGKRGVSLPFTDICHPVAEGPEVLQALIAELNRYGGEAGWRHVDFKGGDGMVREAGSEPYAEHVTHMLRFGDSLDRIEASFRSSTRRNIRKACREGVEATPVNTLEGIAEFYRMHCRTRRRHGLPPQPWGFFRRIHEHVIAAGRGMVILVAHHGKTIGGAVYFFFRDRAIFKFGASERAFQHLRANNLVMWDAIRRLFSQGFRSLHFGRSDSGGRGLIQFKRGWGAEEGRVVYHRLPCGQRSHASCNGRFSSSPLFRLMPIPVLRVAGSLLYRHVG